MGPINISSVSMTNKMNEHNYFVHGTFIYIIYMLCCVWFCVLYSWYRKGRRTLRPYRVMYVDVSDLVLEMSDCFGVGV